MEFKDKIRTLSFGVKKDRTEGDRSYLASPELRGHMRQYNKRDHRPEIVEAENGRRAGVQVEHKDGRVDAYATPAPARARLSLSGED